MYFNIVLLLCLFVIIVVNGGHGSHGSHRDLSAGDATIECNKYFRYVAHVGALSVFHGHRHLALLNVAIHNTLNSIDDKYNTFKNKIYTPPNSHINAAAAVLGACYTIRYYAIDNTFSSNSLTLAYSTTLQTAMHNDLESFIDDLKDQIHDGSSDITYGFNFGVLVATDTINYQDGDGWNGIVAPIVGVYPYIPGKWYSFLPADGYTYNSGGALYPQFAYITLMGLGNASIIYVPPRPDLNTSEFLASYYDVYYHGNRSNSYNIRTTSESEEATLIGTSPPWTLTNHMVELIIGNNKDELDDNDIAYIYAQQALNSYDSLVHNYYWKRLYSYDRPSQLIHNGGNGYTADLSWLWNVVVFSSSEYPAGHPEEMSAGTEAIRLALYTVGLLSSSTDDVIPGGPVSICHGGTANFTVVPVAACSNYVTVRKFGQLKDKTIRARVSGGMHYAISGLRGREAGEAVAAYNIATHMTPK